MTERKTDTNRRHDRDTDPSETREWLDSLEAVIRNDSLDRAAFLIQSQAERLAAHGYRAELESEQERTSWSSSSLTTPYVNTIAPTPAFEYPGNLALEAKIENIIRWNAMALVVRANRDHPGLGGHISSYQSAATLYEVGFNHFFRAPDDDHDGDLVFFQGHSAPGIYARAYLEGRLTEEQLKNYRQELNGLGLPAYPHPRQMKRFWQFSTVSMGMTALFSIYQARFLQYLDDRGLTRTRGRQVWAFLGDGEMDEPESLSALSLAAREKLDNLIFVINCNLQRLDGPVRGNSKIIQELEATFRGAGWNVIKVIWGSRWDPLFARDPNGSLLSKRLEEMLDGDFQRISALENGAEIRRELFGSRPELLEIVEDLADSDLLELDRGGHDAIKVYSAYARARNHREQPTVILAKTVKGYGMGFAGEGLNITHQLKKLGVSALRSFRDRFKLPIQDRQLESIPFYRPEENSPEIEYLKRRRMQLGGALPRRRKGRVSIRVPELSSFQRFLEGTGGREVSMTSTLVRIIHSLGRGEELRERLVPIVADGARTFGMEGLFRTMGIYQHSGQLYSPVDADRLMSYREDSTGSILQEGVNEAGALASWIAAGTSHSTSEVPMIPFFVVYGIYGFQRLADLIWAGADMMTRGFLIGAVSGRTTINGEGLHIQDGHSHLIASTVPNCIAYDPAFAYELAVIVREGIRRMYQQGEDIFYYITTSTENYSHPALPEGVEQGICRGMYKFASLDAGEPKAQLLASGPIFMEALSAAALLHKEFGVSTDVWSVTSYTELRRDGLEVERWNRVHNDEERKQAYVTECLQDRRYPVIAVSDFMKLYSDQIRAFVPGHFVALGTDGFGRSDTKSRLRRFFEVDRHFIAVAALKALAAVGSVDDEVVSRAIERFGIKPPELSRED